MKLSYSGVMASAAMFVALGGTSYAVAKLPRDSVTTTQVKDRSLKAEDLANGVMPPAGPRGPRGPQGTQGSQGDRGPSNAIVRRRQGAANVGYESGASVDVATMKVPAGQWVVRYRTQAYFFPTAGATEGAWFGCLLIRDGAPWSDGRDVLLGNGPGQSGAASIADDVVLRTNAETKLVLRCSHSNQLSPGGQIPGFRFTNLIATQMASIDEENVTG